MQGFSIKDCLTLPQQKQGFSRQRSISQRKGSGGKASLRQYSICVDEVEKKNRRNRGDNFCTQKEPLPNGAQFASWFRKEAIPRNAKSGGFMETEAMPRRADMPTGAASS